MTKTNKEILKEASNVGKIMHSPFMLAVLVRELADILKEQASAIKVAEDENKNHLATIKRMNEITTSIGMKTKVAEDRIASLTLELKLANEIIDRYQGLTVERFEKALNYNKER